MDRSGDHLFAGSGFTTNQHRTVALRHNIYLLEQVFHCLALIDNVTDAQIRKELLAKLVVFLLQAFLQIGHAALGIGIANGNSDAIGNML